MTDENTTGGDPLDLLPGGDEALITELSSLGEIDWPADEVGDRIAYSVAAAVGQRAEVEHGAAAGAVRGAGRRARPPRGRSGRLRWLAVGAAAAVALAVVGVVQLTGSPHRAPHLSRPGAGGPKKITRTTSPAQKARGATRTWLTAMRIVGQDGTLRAIGAADINDNFLTCVTRSVCYTLGSLGGQSADIARSVNGGATWTSGAPLPSTNGQFDSQAAVSCPRPLSCFLPYGSGLLATSDGFAHYHVLPVSMPGTSDVISMVSCPTTEHCVAAFQPSGTRQPFIYSDDGGASWTAASSPAVTADDIIGGLRCDPGGACIAAVIAGDEANPLVAALSSTDGGRSWSMSRTYSMVDQQLYMVSCGDGRSCVVGSNDGYLAWIHSAVSGRILIRVQAFPSSWGTTGIALSCATGLDCFVETGASSTVGYTGHMLQATRDGGLTWTSTPLAPSVPQDTAVYLSCPVAAGCVAMANDGSGDQSSWVVLSNLRKAR